LQKQKSAYVPLEKVEVRHTKDGKGGALFAMEDIDKDDYVIKYVGKIEYKRRENNYMMKINRMICGSTGIKMVDLHNT
jgi:SET domain-containing protein